MVDVGCPHLERHRGNLEGETYKKETDTDEQQHIVARERLLGRQRLHDAAEVGVFCRAVDERDSVEEECRRESTEDEVLETRFLAFLAAAIARGENVEGKAERLETEEQHDEVLRGHHDDATDCSGKIQHEQLGAILTFANEVVTRREACKHHRDTDGDGSENRKMVEGESVADDRFGSTIGQVVPKEEAQHDRCCRGCGTDDSVETTRPLREQ